MLEWADCVAPKNLPNGPVLQESQSKDAGKRDSISELSVSSSLLTGQS